MATDNDWADGSELAGMSRSGNVLEQMGYDPDEARGDPAMRSQIMSRVASPMAMTPMQRGAQLPAQAAAAVRQTPPAQTAAPAQPPMRSTAQVSPSGTTPDPEIPDTLSLGRQGITGALAAGKQASEVATQMQNDTGPDTSAIDARIKSESMPTPYRDPHTGKVLESAQEAGYKPSVWGEIGRGVRGALVGGLTGGIPGALVGAIEPQDIRGGTAYGAPDKAYQSTEANREAALTSDQGQRAATLQNFKDLTDRRKGIAGVLRDVATSENDAGKQAAELTNASTNQVKAQTEQQKADTEAATRKDNSPEGVAALTEAQFNERTKLADRLNLQGSMRAILLANGKLPDPRQATAEEIARSQALRTFVQQNKRQPQTMDEINSINAAASGRLKDEGGESQPPAVVSSAVAAAVGKKEEYEKGLTRLPNGNYLKAGGDRHDTKDVIPAAEYAQAVDQYRLDLNKSIAKHGWEMDPTGNMRRAGGTQPPAPVQAAAGAAAPPVAAQASPTGTMAPQPRTADTPPDADQQVRVGGRMVGGKPVGGTIVGHMINGVYVPLKKGK